MRKRSFFARNGCCTQATSTRPSGNGKPTMSGMAWHYLDACRSEFRGWEYNYLYTLFNQNQRTLKGIPVRCAAWPSARTANGSPAAAGTRRSRCGTRQRSGNAHAQGAYRYRCIAWPSARTANGSPAAVVTRRSKVWDAATGQEMLTLKGHTGDGVQRGLQPGRQTDRQAAAGTRRLKVWDAATGQEMLTLKGHTDSVLAWPSARTANGSQAAAVTRRSRCGTRRRVRKCSRSRGILATVSSVAFSPDGKRIASGSEDKT